LIETRLDAIEKYSIVYTCRENRRLPGFAASHCCEIGQAHMRITLVNPNTTASMTDIIAAAARAVAAPGTEIVAVTSKHGAVSIEGHYDEAMSFLGLAEAIRDGEAEGSDAYIIACFGDPGLLGARELTRAPVLGIAEAAMHAATFVATGFSIVTTLSRTRIIAEHLLRDYGMERQCRKVRATDLPVLELENPKSNARAVILAECERAVEEDGSGAIVLGCAGMADLARFLEDRLQVPVIDGVAAAVKFAEALIGLGLKTSKRGDLAFPEAKAYGGSLAAHAPSSFLRGGNGSGLPR
jgi:allantoin racemase